MSCIINVNAAAFRQALSSALLFVDSKHGSENMSQICLHLKDGEEILTVSSMDGHGFYHQQVPLAFCEGNDGKMQAASLPRGEGAFCDVGQLLLNQQAAAAILKMLPGKKCAGFLTFEVTPSDKLQYRQNVCFTGPDNTSYSFTAIVTAFPDYTAFFTRAKANKDARTTPQGRIFPIAEFARIAKALPEKFFNVFLGGDHDGPCLVEQGDNISIVFMPGKWAA